MGRDKALLELNGAPMAQRVADAMKEAGALDILAIGGNLQALRELGLVCIPDRLPGEGPLGGVLTSLGACSTDIAFVAACDLLAPSSAAMKATVTALIEHPDADLAVPRTANESAGHEAIGGPCQWLHTAWRQRARPKLTARFASGERAVHRAVRDAGLVVAMVGGLDPAVLADADTPDDLVV